MILLLLILRLSNSQSDCTMLGLTNLVNGTDLDILDDKYTLELKYSSFVICKENDKVIDAVFSIGENVTTILNAICNITDGWIYTWKNYDIPTNRTNYCRDITAKDENYCSLDGYERRFKLGDKSHRAVTGFPVIAVMCMNNNRLNHLFCDQKKLNIQLNAQGVNSEYDIDVYCLSNCTANLQNITNQVNQTFVYTTGINYTRENLTKNFTLACPTNTTFTDSRMSEKSVFCNEAIGEWMYETVDEDGIPVNITYQSLPPVCNNETAVVPVVLKCDISGLKANTNITILNAQSNQIGLNTTSVNNDTLLYAICSDTSFTFQSNETRKDIECSYGSVLYDGNLTCIPENVCNVKTLTPRLTKQNLTVQTNYSNVTKLQPGQSIEVICVKGTKVYGNLTQMMNLTQNVKMIVDCLNGFWNLSSMFVCRKSVYYTIYPISLLIPVILTIL